MLSVTYIFSGEYEKAIETENQAIRLKPNFANEFALLGRAFMELNRFAEVREVYEQALAQKLDGTGIRGELYALAFINGDAAAMQQQLDALRGRRDEYEGFRWQAETAAFAGQLQRAQELSRRAADLAAQSNAKEVAARYASDGSLWHATFGQCQQSKAVMTQALTLARDRGSLPAGSLGLALCGEAGQVQMLIAEMKQRYPKDTIINTFYLPMIQAASEIKGNNPAMAIQTLESLGRYEGGARFWPQYLRGQAYLKLNRGAEAAAEFQKILDHRGQSPLSALYPLAHLGLARAAALTGDVAKSRKAYQDFFALWKNADANLPVLIEAKKEYEKMKSL